MKGKFIILFLSYVSLSGIVWGQHGSSQAVLHADKVELGIGGFLRLLQCTASQQSQETGSACLLVQERPVMDIQEKHNCPLVVQDENAEKAKNQRHSIVILCLVALLLVVLFAYDKAEMDNELIVSTKDAMLMQCIRLLQQKNDELLRQKLVVQDKECKLREYIIKEKGLKENIIRKEVELQEYMKQQKEIRVKMLQMTQVAGRIESMNSLNAYQKRRKKEDLPLSRQEIGHLFNAVNLCYDNFEKRLRANYPKLTDEDIYVCCLIKMGISNQDIVVLLTSNESAMKKRRYRIKHDKLGLIKENISLSDFLENY